MATSRIQRFKDYRNSLIKEDCPVSETPITENDHETSTFETTSTLPLDQVMKEISTEDQEAVFRKKQNSRFVLQIVLFSFVVVLVIAAIVLIAIWLF